MLNRRLVTTRRKKEKCDGFYEKDDLKASSSLLIGTHFLSIPLIHGLHIAFISKGKIPISSNDNMV